MVSYHYHILSYHHHIISYHIIKSYTSGETGSGTVAKPDSTGIGEVCNQPERAHLRDCFDDHDGIHDHGHDSTPLALVWYFEGLFFMILLLVSALRNVSGFSQ